MNRRTIHPGFLTALWLLPVLALLQTTLAPRLVVNGAMPGLVLVAVVNWGILRGTDQGMMWGLIGGFCVDLFSGLPMGTSTVAMVVVASLVSLGGTTFIRTHALLPPATILLATFTYYSIVLFILESTHPPVDWVAGLRDVALPAAIYNAVLNVPAYVLLRRLEDRLYPQPRASW